MRRKKKPHGLRFIPKVWQDGRTPVWGVYDLKRGSWPLQIPGGVKVRQEHKSEESAQQEAERVDAAVAELEDW